MTSGSGSAECQKLKVSSNLIGLKARKIGFRFVRVFAGGVFPGLDIAISFSDALAVQPVGTRESVDTNFCQK